MTLDEAVKTYSPDDLIHIGNRSAFFFIGNSSEYEQYVTKDLRSREVLKQYIQPVARHPVIKVAGAEIGKYWTRGDWEKDYGKRS